MPARGLRRSCLSSTFRSLYTKSASQAEGASSSTPASAANASPLSANCSVQHNRFLPPHVHGILYLSSHPARPDVHYVLGNPQTLLATKRSNRDTCSSPAHRLLPFFAGTCVGALGLAAWESKASPPPYQPPHHYPPNHQQQGLHSHPRQAPGGRLPELLLDTDQGAGQAPPVPPHTLTSMPAGGDTAARSSVQAKGRWGSDSSCSNNAGGGDGSNAANSSSLNSSNYSCWGVMSKDSLSSSFSSGLIGLGLSSMGGLGPTVKDGIRNWLGWHPRSHNISPEGPPSAPPSPRPTSHSQSDTSPYTQHADALPPPLPPPCSSQPPLHHTHTPPPSLHPSQHPANLSTSSCSNQEQQQPWLPLTRTSISDASCRVAPAVVHLLVTGSSQQQGHQQQQQGGWGMGGMGVVAPGRHTRRWSGSGFVYDARGYILTNAHVVEAAVDDELLAAQGGKSILPDLSSGRSSSRSRKSSSGNRLEPLVLTVTLQDGRILKGKVVCLDRTADVAVVKVESPEPLPVAPIGDSSKLRVGEWVVALGSPLMLKHSVTAGIVSCVERRGHELGLPSSRSPYIQTDVAINQGNSGGPLINLDGEVVGMSMMKAIAADGVSFCLPISSVQDIVSSFSTHGRMRYPYVGITMVELSQGALGHVQANLPKLLMGPQSAVMVQNVHKGSPAEAAGLLPEDIIVSLDGRSQLSMNDVVEHFGASIHCACTLSVLRRVSNPDGSYGPYVPQLTHLTPIEHQPQ